MTPSRRTNRSKGRAALVGIALLCTAAGLWFVVAKPLAGTPSLAATATVDGLAVDVHDAGWVPMDAHTMDNQGGFQMPAQMMPGAPAGDEMRLGVGLTLLNTDDATREFNLAEEFVLIGGTIDGTVRLHSDTFGLLHRLNPGSAVNGVLYFDTTVPATNDPPLVLRWTRSGETVSLSIPFDGAAPSPHGHNS